MCVWGGGGGGGGGGVSQPCQWWLPYSLKFSRLKIFAVFAGCILTTKILSREKFSTYACAIICGRGHLSAQTNCC